MVDVLPSRSLGSQRGVAALVLSLIFVANGKLVVDRTMGDQTSQTIAGIALVPRSDAALETLRPIGIRETDFRQRALIAWRAVRGEPSSPAGRHSQLKEFDILSQAPGRFIIHSPFRFSSARP
jgi:hypothetical protein